MIKELEAKMEDIPKLLYEVYDVPSTICEYIKEALIELEQLREFDKFCRIGKSSKYSQNVVIENKERSEVKLWQMKEKQNC